jgi:DNA-binding transcriptional LysR family regulator
MGFDTRLLTGISVLAEVVATGSFARAAEALGMTPSGVSRAVARLEARVGVRLFDRTPRSVTLTEEGQRFYARVVPLLGSMEEAATELAGSSATVSGRLRISVDPWFARMTLAQQFPRFTQQYPELSVEMQVSNHREEMMTGTDLAIRFGPAEDSSLIARKLLETRVLTCASPGYVRKHGAPATPDDLREHEAVLFRDPQTGRPFPWEFTRKGKVTRVEVRGRLVTDDPSVAIAACVAGQGIFQSLELGLDGWLKAGKLVQLLPRWAEERFPLYAYYHSRQHPPAKIRAFLNFLAEITATVTH